MKTKDDGMKQTLNAQRQTPNEDGQQAAGQESKT